MLGQLLLGRHCVAHGEVPRVPHGHCQVQTKQTEDEDSRRWYEKEELEKDFFR